MNQRNNIFQDDGWSKMRVEDYNASETNVESRGNCKEESIRDCGTGTQY